MVLSGLREKERSEHGDLRELWREEEVSEGYTCGRCGTEGLGMMGHTDCQGLPNCGETVQAFGREFTCKKSKNHQGECQFQAGEEDHWVKVSW